VTSSPAPIDDTEVLRQLLDEVDVLLLDFDGPVCSVFAGFPAPLVADQLREVLAEGGVSELPLEVEKTEDPFDVFKHAAALGEDEARYVEAALRACEVEAVKSAEPAAASHAVMRTWADTGHRLGIVSNNSAEAIEVYLHRFGLVDAVDVVVGRQGHDPVLLKPNPYSLGLAMSALNIAPDRAVLVGDSTTDIQAAKLIRCRSIGFANRPAKQLALTALSPDVVVTEMQSILDQVIVRPIE
jgi:phosphoglycolate phosphatase